MLDFRGTVYEWLSSAVTRHCCRAGDACPLIALLKETVARFNEKLDAEAQVPKLQPA